MIVDSWLRSVYCAFTLLGTGLRCVFNTPLPLSRGELLLRCVFTLHAASLHFVPTMRINYSLSNSFNLL